MHKNIPVLKLYALPYHLCFIFSQPPDCKAVIERLKNCSEAELLTELKKFETWNLGKCELFHWIEPLDVLDTVLEEAAARVRPDGWLLTCDMPDYAPVSEPGAAQSSPPPPAVGAGT